MAADTTVAGEGSASDYSPTKREPAPQINAETRVAPTCMIWSMMIGLAVIGLIVVLWAVSNIGTIFQ